MPEYRNKSGYKGSQNCKGNGNEPIFPAYFFDKSEIFKRTHGAFWNKERIKSKRNYTESDNLHAYGKHYVRFRFAERGIESKSHSYKERDKNHYEIYKKDFASWSAHFDLSLNKAVYQCDYPPQSDESDCYINGNDRAFRKSRGRVAYRVFKRSLVSFPTRLGEYTAEGEEVFFYKTRLFDGHEKVMSS